MSSFSKAYIPYGGYYSTPFCRWQGSMQNENAIELGAKTARRWFLEKKKIDPASNRLPVLWNNDSPVAHLLWSQLGSRHAGGQ